MNDGGCKCVYVDNRRDLSEFVGGSAIWEAFLDYEILWLFTMRQLIITFHYFLDGKSERLVCLNYLFAIRTRFFSICNYDSLVELHSNQRHGRPNVTNRPRSILNLCVLFLLVHSIFPLNFTLSDTQIQTRIERSFIYQAEIYVHSINLLECVCLLIIDGK